MTEQELLDLANLEVAALAKEWGTTVPRVALNRRFKRSMGRYNPNRSLVEVAPWMLMLGYSKLAAREVVRHEMTHHIDWELNKSLSHGQSFKDTARAVGGVYLGGTADDRQREAAMTRDGLA